ncbi:hypothetical protein [Sinorhizobium fredii]|uniref:hypothetical protein n=1 Tax=Rhizobium fredii TaxID=380 RepID=UPI0035177A07
MTLGTPVFRINALNSDGANNTIEWTHGCWPIGGICIRAGLIEECGLGQWHLWPRVAFSGNRHRA